MAAIRQGFWALLRVLLSRRTTVLALKIPPRAYEAIMALRLQPEDTAGQVVKDALQTHNRVRAAMARGEVCVRRGTLIEPLDLDHLTTPAKKRASWSVIEGGKE